MNGEKIPLYIKKDLEYPTIAPYHPDQPYPELKIIFSRIPTDPENRIYFAIRTLFKLLEMDAGQYGTKYWNPLSEIINPGDKVLIKPNFVMHEYGSQLGQNAMHTHGSVIRAIADYALLALKGEGELIVADSPLQEADFNKLDQEAGLLQIKDWYLKNGINNFLYYDLRKEWAVLSSTGGMITKRVALPGDPKGYKLIDLEKYSSLESITTPNTKFSITDYNNSITQQHHCPGRHQYLIAQTLLDADVILNLPKLKTHMKTGLTCCLKNMVGINVAKDYLPHHRLGSPAKGGDEFPQKTVANVLFKRIRESLNERAPLWVWKSFRFVGLPFRNIYSRLFDKSNDVPPSLIYGGSWYGNDTVWRMVHDMNKIAFFAGKDGTMKTDKQRKYFTVVDAIVAGEENGPLTPIAKHCGMLLAGMDPLRVDVLAALLMGFEPNRIPLLTNYNCQGPFAFSDYNGRLETLDVCFNKQNATVDLDSLTHLYSFIPPTGWNHHIKRE